MKASTLWKRTSRFATLPTFVRTARAFAYGQTYFTILSPRIQSYTVGVEPNPAFWGEERPAKPLSADVVSWMARPDNGPGGMGRGSGQGFFRKPYHYGAQPPGEPPITSAAPTGPALRTDRR